MQIEAFRTGQVAKVCKVATQTVVRWIDSGLLCGYRIPGSKDRRVTRAKLIEFMDKHEMPENWLTDFERKEAKRCIARSK